MTGNFTQTPNALFDIAPTVSNSCLRVLLAITRKTFGWHKSRDRLSISQLEKLSGLSRRAVINGVQEALELGLLERFAVGQMYEYQLVLNDDPCTTCTSSEPASAPRAPVASAPRAPTKESLKESYSKESSRETARNSDETPDKTHHSRKNENETLLLLRKHLGDMLEVYIKEERHYRDHWLRLSPEKVKGAVQRASEREGPKCFSTRLKEELDALTKPVVKGVSKVPPGESAADTQARLARERARAAQFEREADAKITNYAAMSEREFERHLKPLGESARDTARRIRERELKVLAQDRDARSREQGEAARRYALAEQARQLGA